MIWYIIKKDLKLLWPLVLIVAAVHAMNATMWFMLGNFGEPEGLRRIAQLFIVMVILGVIALIVTAVHQDIVPGDRQDWLVRPIRRRDLLLAKLLFVLLLVQGPMLLVDLAQCMASGFLFQDAFSAALSRNIYMLVCISLPVLGIAAMTSTVIEVIGALLAIFLLLVVYIIAMEVGTPDGGNNTFGSMSGHWLMLELWSAVALAVAFVVIPMQYFRRATMQTRGIALGALLALLPVSVLIPWSGAFAFEAWLSPDPGAARTVAIAFDPALGKLALKPGAVSRANSIWLPLRVSGLPPDSVLLKDRADVRIIGRDGAILYHGLALNTAETISGANAAGAAIPADFPVRTAAGGDARIHQFMLLPRKVHEIAHSQSVRLEVDYSLTLFRIKASDTIAAVDGDKRIDNLGLCKTKIDDDGDEVQIGCLLSRHDPITCGTFVLENAVSSQRNPVDNYCSNPWLPYTAHFAPNALQNFGLDLHFRDPQGLAQYPVDSAQLAKAQVVTKTYQPVAHFTRHLVIPEIRLGDWEADASKAGAAPPPQ